MGKGYSIFRRGKAGPYYVAWNDGTGRRRTRRASGERRVADEIGRALAADADRVRLGVLDHVEATAKEAGKAEIATHVKAWEKTLRAKGNTEKHVGQHVSRVTKLLGMAGVRQLADVTGEKIQTALVGVSTPQNARHYLTAIRGFVKWCIVTDRLFRSPILAVSKPAVAGETFQRQPFTDDEVSRLLDATRDRKARTPFRGRDRAMFYRVMAYTGLRRSEAASLTPESFDLTAGLVTVEARYSKHRRRDRQPIPVQLLEELGPWLARKRPGARVFAIPPHYRWERTFRLDCKAAGITVKDGCRLGMHSLRRWFITSVIRGGDLAVAQELARHSTPTLTKKYADLTRRDQDAALATLPRLGTEKQAKRRKRA